MTVIATDDRTAWLEWRRGGIGGSDAAAIAGLDPWKSPTSVYLDKTGWLPLESQENEAQRWGRRLERAVIAEFEDVEVERLQVADGAFVHRGSSRSGRYVGCEQAQLVHPARPWMRATVDGLVFDNPKERNLELLAAALGLLEIKTASWRSPVDWKHGVPDHVALQIQHNLEVAQKDQAWLAVLLNGQELLIHEIERDPLVIAQLVALEEAFWRRVQERRPPPADAAPATSEALREAYREPVDGSVLQLDQQQHRLVRDYVTATAEVKRVQDEQALYRNSLMTLLGANEIGVYRDQPVVTWKRVSQDRVDLDALRLKHPKLVKRFTTSTTHRRLHVPAAAPEGDEE